ASEPAAHGPVRPGPDGSVPLGSGPIMSGPIMSGPIRSGPIRSEHSAGYGSRGVQVHEARSEASNNEVRGTLGSSGHATQGLDPAGPKVSRETSPVVIPEIPSNPADTPIARAAEAAVGVRGGGQPGP